MKVEEDTKILLVYKDFDDNLQIESVWASREGQHFRLQNVPFFAQHLACSDLIAVERDRDSLYFLELIEPSGHSTIQLVLNQQDNLLKIGEELVVLGCYWEESHLKRYVSVDVPAEVDYAHVKRYLEKGLLGNQWDYREACLSKQHRSQIAHT